MTATPQLKQLWSDLEKKFCDQLQSDFSDLNTGRYIDHFAPRSEIIIEQYGKDHTGKGGKGKTYKVYTGNPFTAALRKCLPAKLVAKTLFKRLRKQGYSYSKIDLLGVRMEGRGESAAHIRFKRFNSYGKCYESAEGLYDLVLINGRWCIKTMRIYDDDEQYLAIADLSEMWSPDAS